uniref:Uncharacterized protein n=1 Tax=Nelumbo nucifera TaxID=4432 RepID=A0A822YPU3_NELNU|nr:TPA_asm: hypothetical protein HUJ06_012210 [Nelumbo nucifera]
MITETDLSNGFVHGTENSLTRLKHHVFMQNLETPDGKIGFSEKGLNFLRGSEIGHNGFPLKPSINGNSGAQELTLSYLCDNSKMDFQDRDF